jgi:rubrerythrin
MQTTTTPHDPAALAARLNDLLQLDHDALQAYDIAIQALRGERHRETLRRFRADHERHVAELTELIRSLGTVPVQLPHLPTGAFKLAMQGLGGAAGALGGGDAAVLLAFKANERQVRDKYRRVADLADLPASMSATIRRAAADEATHYAWALETLDELGVDQQAPAARVERAVEIANARMADVAEDVGRRAMLAADRVRRDVTDPARANPVAAALVAIGTGLVVGNLFRRR